MCSIFLAYQAHPKYRLILAANHDEFYERATAKAGFWTNAPEILAGRDLLRGGTWLGVTRGGRFSAVTNYRDPMAPTGNLSRGNLVSDFLHGAETPIEYLRRIQTNAAAYSGFNLLVGDFGSAGDAEIGYGSNRDATGAAKILERGIYGLSNHLLDTPWRKIERGKSALAKLIAEENFSDEALFEILRDDSKAADVELPETGVGLELERLLSSIFIETPVYGTRCSTVLFVETSGKVSFAERTFRAGGAGDWEAVKFEFEIEKNQFDVDPANGLSCSV